MAKAVLVAAVYLACLDASFEIDMRYIIEERPMVLCSSSRPRSEKLDDQSGQSAITA